VIPSYQNIICLKILKRYNEYCANHNLLRKKEIQNENIRKLVFDIHNTIKKLEQRYQEDPQITGKFFAYKLERKLLKKHKVWVNSLMHLFSV